MGLGAQIRETEERELVGVTSVDAGVSSRHQEDIPHTFPEQKPNADDEHVAVHTEKNKYPEIPSMLCKKRPIPDVKYFIIAISPMKKCNQTPWCLLHR